MSWTISESPPNHAEQDFLQRYCDRQQAKERRRSSVVDPKLQYSLVKSFLVVFVLASCVYYATMTLAFLEVYRILDATQDLDHHQIVAKVQHLEGLAAWAFAGFLLAFTLIIWWAGLKLSHRIAGPIFALTRHLNRVAEGRTDADLRFRKNDYFSALQDAFNRHMETYRRRLSGTEPRGE